MTIFTNWVAGNFCRQLAKDQFKFSTPQNITRSDNTILVTIDVESLYPSIQPLCLQQKKLLLFTLTFSYNYYTLNINFNFGPIIFQRIIRSSTFPTDKQFMDIIITKTAPQTPITSQPENLQSFRTCQHVQMQAIPQGYRVHRAAGNSTLTILVLLYILSTRHLATTQDVTRASIFPQRTYPICRPFSCASTNIIYLITCIQ